MGKPQRSRIIHVLGALVAGGAERFAIDLMIALTRAGYRVELVCLVPRRDAVGDRWEALLRAEGVPIHTGRARSLRPSTVLWLSQLLRAPDVAIAHLHLDYTEFAYYFARFLHRRRYGVLRKLHNTIVPRKGLKRWVFEHSDVRMSVAGGETTHEVFKGRLRGEQVCIPNGMNFYWPAHDFALRDERLRAIGLDPCRTHYMTVGSMLGASPREGQKAHDDLIAAWRRGRLGERGGCLHILGDGPLRPQLEPLTEGDPSIRFHGVVAGVPDWLIACDVFVLPSRWEGLPNAGIEAVGTGIPCIFSDIKPCRELRSTSAAFFPPGDTAALAARLEERLGRLDGGADGPEIAEMRRRYGIARPLGEYLAIYEKIHPGLRKPAVPSEVSACNC